MKLLALAWKDLRRQFRSGLLLVMMLGAPLLLTGLIDLAFSSPAGTPEIATVTLAVADLDAPPAGAPVAAGRTLVDALSAPELASLVQVVRVDDGAAARAMVARGEAGAALVIPADFTAAMLGEVASAAASLTTDPARPLGAGVAQDVIQRALDALTASALAARLTTQSVAGPAAGLLATQAAMRVAMGAQHDAGDGVTLKAPVGATGSFVTRMAGQVMGAMMIFFVFFTGAYGASSLLREQEEGTLPRLYTTPTGAATVLGGKFLGTAITLAVQVAVLLSVSALVFGIRWGRPAPVLLASVALIVAAAGFGVLLLAFVRTSRQSGPMFGVVLTVTGMVGGLMTATFTDLPPAFELASRFTPQGWAMAGWRLCVDGRGVGAMALPLAVTVGIGLACLAVGVPLLRRRFAQGAPS
ncbi:MAG: ABC transporter permease [Deinococcales bacterium]